MKTLMTLTMIILNIIQTVGDCPRSCECKWKSGKESVLCVNANMTKIPKHLDSGTQVLVLTGNRLQKIEADEFFNASLLNLQKIFLSRCNLRFIDRSSFRKIINLVELDLSYNDLHSVPSHTFEFIKELRELRLNGNPIVRLLNYAFKMVPRLTKLDLSECRIAYVEIKAFQGLENSLEWLKLNKNKITNIKPQALVILGNLHGLELSGNAWNCTCGLRTLREWMIRRNVPYSIPPICIHPPRLSGKIWDKLELDEFACIPSIKAVTSRKNGEEGSNVTMSCSITGIPEPRIRWLRKNHVIANLSASGPRKKLYIVRMAEQSSNLTILEADAQDNGVYICRAENKAGKSEANITLSMMVKPASRIWSLKMIIAVGVVSLLFATAVGLLTYCAWSLRKRKSYVQHPVTRKEMVDDYEMKNKNVIGYNKIREYGNHCSSNATDNLRRISVKHSASDRLRNEKKRMENIDGSESADRLLNQRSEKADNLAWSFLRMSEAEDRLNESRLSPDLHTRSNGQEPQRNSPGTRTEESYTEDLSFAHSVESFSFLRSRPQYLNSEMTRESLFTTTLPENAEKFPDLLELSQNEKNLINNNLFVTLPRKRSYKMKRARHGSFGSESHSPLLPESSEDSCDSNYSFGRRKFFDKNSSLPTSPSSLSQTPILNILDGSYAQSPTILKHKSWELEKFLKEYRNLQGQLFEMKDSCQNLKENRLKFREDTSNAVESATISKMISPMFLENSSFKIDFLDEANSFGPLYNEIKFLEEGNNNPDSVLSCKSKPNLSDHGYWSSGNRLIKSLQNSRNSVYKS